MTDDNQILWGDSAQPSSDSH